MGLLEGLFSFFIMVGVYGFIIYVLLRVAFMLLREIFGGDN